MQTLQHAATSGFQRWEEGRGEGRGVKTNFLSLKSWPGFLAIKRRRLLNIESFYIPLRNQYIIKMNSNTPLKIKKSSQTFGRCKIENYKIHKTSHLLSTNLIQPHTYIIILINITV